jgi:hypothetical protein
MANRKNLRAIHPGEILYEEFLDPLVSKGLWRDRLNPLASVSVEMLGV